MAEQITAIDNRKGKLSGEATKVGEEKKARSVRWDDSNMRTTYANVVNVTSTREEVMLLFGTNQTSMVGGQQDLTVQLSDRLIVNPYAAKRLLLILGGVLKEYENRFGELRLEAMPKPGNA